MKGKSARKKWNEHSAASPVMSSSWNSRQKDLRDVSRAFISDSSHRAVGAENKTQCVTVRVCRFHRTSACQVSRNSRSPVCDFVAPIGSNQAERADPMHTPVI